MDCYIKSLYLCVKDMDRAIKFYENFFEMEVTERDDIYSVFDIKGFRLGLFAFEKRMKITVLEVTVCRVLVWKI